MKLARFVIIALGCMLAHPALAAVAHSTDATGDCTSQTQSTSCSKLTIPSSLSNPVLVEYVSYYGANVTPSGTWNGGTVTLVNYHYDTTGANGTAILCLPNPTSGAHALVATATGAAEVNVMGAVFTGADQTTPCQHYVSSSQTTGTTASVTITSASSDLATSVSTQGQQFTASGSGCCSGTSIIVDDVISNTNIVAQYNAGSASVTSSTTAQASVTTGTVGWNVSGVDIVAASGGGSGGQFSKFMLHQ